MKFNINKCAKLSMKRGKYSSSKNINLDLETTIRELNHHDTYKYLGVAENTGIDHKTMKEKVKKEYLRRLRLVLESQLNSQNKFKAINSIAMPVLMYSFTIINWTLSEIKQLDTKTRKLLTCYRSHHPKADIDRLYLPRSQGGRGLLQAEMYYKLTFIGVNAYLYQTTDWMMVCVKNHEKSKKKLYSITQKAKDYSKEYNHDDPEPEPPVSALFG